MLGNSQSLLLNTVRYGLVVRIAGSHPAGPGSIPGNGILFPYSSPQQPLTCPSHTQFKAGQKGVLGIRESRGGWGKLRKNTRRGWDSNPRGQSPLD